MVQTKSHQMGDKNNPDIIPLTDPNVNPTTSWAMARTTDGPRHTSHPRTYSSSPYNPNYIKKKSLAPTLALTEQQRIAQLEHEK